MVNYRVLRTVTRAYSSLQNIFSREGAKTTHLSDWSNQAPHDAKKHGQPSQKQAQAKMPLHVAKLFNGLASSKRFGIPVVLSPSGHLALLQGEVTKRRALRVGQRVLEWGEQVVEAPGQNHVVVGADEEAHHHRRHAHAPQVGVDGVPDADGALAQTLSQGELQVEQGDSQEE